MLAFFLAGVAFAEGGRPPLDVVFFGSSTCDGCQRLKEHVMPRVQRLFSGRVSVTIKNLDDVETFKELLKYEKHYATSDDEMLKVFVGKQFLSGAEGIENGIEKVIATELNAGNTTYLVPSDESTNQDQSGDALRERFFSFGTAAVALAGLVDGVNPCAFATIIFLISLISFLGKTRREMLVVGVGFTVAVFGTYLLLGIGVFKALKAFSVSARISRGITLGAIALVFALAGLSLVDYVRYARSGNAKSMSLVLPRRLKFRIRRIMRVHLDGRRLLFGSVLVGVLVSLLESVCTGQVYLPTIVYIMRDPAFRVRAFLLLLLYNLMFILPLVVVFAVAYAGVGSESMARFFRQRVGVVKLGLTALFACLGTLLIYSL